MSGREPPHAEFEPTVLAPRRRRVDPVLLGAMVVVIGLGAAVVKPWGDPAGGEAATSPTPRPSASLGAPATGRPSEPTIPPAVAEAAPVITWPRAATAITSRDTWGVRAIVRDRDPERRPSADPATGLVERWTATVTDVDGTDIALLETADQGVLALGITFPPDELPLDVRIWRRTSDGEWEWLDAAALGTMPATGAFLFAPPRIGGVPLPTWPTGAYRLQALTGSTIREFEIGLPDRFEVVPGPAAGSGRSSADSPFDPDFSLVASDRLFAVQDGVATPLPAEPAEPMDHVAAWRGNGPPESDPALDVVVSAHLPRATGLGVLMPLGATEASASIVALAPDEDAIDARRVIAIRFTDDGRAPYVIFRAPRAGTWPAGVYRIDAAWTLDGVRHAASYHAELRPGPGAVPDTLAALRAFAPRAGTDVVLGSGGGYLWARELDCDADGLGVVGAAPALIGIGHDVGEAHEAIEATLLLAGGRTVIQPLLVAAEPLDGLTLLAPANGETFVPVPGIYRITLHGADDDRTLTACLGVAILD